MTLATHVTLEERDALHGQVLNHLSGIGDLWSAVQDEDFETAERLGREFADELRLIEDLGWDCAPAAEVIELTMPPDELHRMFTRLHSDIEDPQGDEERDGAETEDEVREFRSRAKRVTEVCERMLNIVGRTPPPDLN
jgi:hypothetical protein